MKTVKFCFMMVIILSSVLLPAQDKQSSGKYYGGFGYFITGYHFYDVNNLNSRLKSLGYQEINTGAFSIGGGGNYIVKNWLIGGEGSGLLGGSQTNDQNKVSASGGYGFFNLGYLLVKTKSILLCPVLGIGGGGMSVNLKDKDDLPASFDDILDQPGRESNVSQGGFLLNFSILSKFILSGYKGEDRAGGFLAGIKAGYILNINNSNWYFEDQQLQNPPSSTLSGPYITLLIGGGGLRKWINLKSNK